MITQLTTFYNCNEQNTISERMHNTLNFEANGFQKVEMNLASAVPGQVYLAQNCTSSSTVSACHRMSLLPCIHSLPPCLAVPLVPALGSSPNPVGSCLWHAKGILLTSLTYYGHMFILRLEKCSLVSGPGSETTTYAVSSGGSSC